jgi:hypothetical protein
VPPRGAPAGPEKCATTCRGVYSLFSIIRGVLKAGFRTHSLGGNSISLRTKRTVLPRHARVKSGSGNRYRQVHTIHSSNSPAKTLISTRGVVFLFPPRQFVPVHIPIICRSKKRLRLSVKLATPSFANVCGWEPSASPPLLCRVSARNLHMVRLLEYMSDTIDPICGSKR